MGIEIAGINKEGSIWMERYGSARVDVPDMPLPKISLFNMTKSFSIHITLIVVSIVVLLYEISASSAQRGRNAGGNLTKLSTCGASKTNGASSRHARQ